MRVFVTGATGFVGSAIVQELLGAGHQVLGLTRSEAGAQALAAATDGVIHTAFIHDFTQYAAAADTDRRAIEVLGAALSGTEKPLVVTSGFANLLKSGPLVTEDDGHDPNQPVMRSSEEAALALAAQGVKAMVIRLAASVHDQGDHGFVPMLIHIARTTGVSGYAGAGNNRWPAVHRRDAARLYRLALEQGVAGARYHGVADEGIPMRELATVIGRHLQVPVAALSAEETASHLGWMALFASLDLAASSALTQQRLGWQPTHPDLLADLAAGHYFVEAGQ